MVVLGMRQQQLCSNAELTWQDSRMESSEVIMGDRLGL